MKGIEACEGCLKIVVLAISLQTSWEVNLWVSQKTVTMAGQHTFTCIYAPWFMQINSSCDSQLSVKDHCEALR